MRAIVFIGILAVMLLGLAANSAKADPALDELDRYQLALNAELNGLDYVLNRNPSAVVVRVWCSDDAQRQLVKTIAERFPLVHVIHVIEVGGACAR